MSPNNQVDDEARSVESRLQEILAEITEVDARLESRYWIGQRYSDFSKWLAEQRAAIMERARDLAHHPRVQEELNLLDVFADGAGLFPIDKPMAAIIQPAEACRPAVCESVLGIAAVDALDDLRDDLAREPLDGRSKDDLLAWFQGRVEKITPLALNDQAREMMEADIADLRRLVGEILTSEMWTT